MKVLLDTNILIHREAGRIVREDIGFLFRWIDHLKYEKCVHPLSIEEITKHQDSNVVETFRIKISSYYILKTLSPDSPPIAALRAKYDKDKNDEIDTVATPKIESPKSRVFQ